MCPPDPRRAPGAATTESSSLIDIRMLRDAAPKFDASVSRAADDIVNLGGGGAFAPLVAPPMIAFAASEEAAPRAPDRRTPLVALAIACAFIATTTVVAIVVTRPARAGASCAAGP